MSLHRHCSVTPLAYIDTAWFGPAHKGKKNKRAAEIPAKNRYSKRLSSALRSPPLFLILLGFQSSVVSHNLEFSCLFRSAHEADFNDFFLTVHAISHCNRKKECWKILIRHRGNIAQEYEVPEEMSSCQYSNGYFPPVLFSSFWFWCQVCVWIHGV